MPCDCLWFPLLVITDVSIIAYMDFKNNEECKDAKKNALTFTPKKESTN